MLIRKLGDFYVASQDKGGATKLTGISKDRLEAIQECLAEVDSDMAKKKGRIVGHYKKIPA